MDVKNIIISRENISEDDIPLKGKELPGNTNLITLPTIDFRKIQSKEVKETLAYFNVLQGFFIVVILLSRLGNVHKSKYPMRRFLKSIFSNPIFPWNLRQLDQRLPFLHMTK